MEKQVLPMIHQEDAWCKMIIPEYVEKKIRILCREIHNIEWSGILFYEVSGSFENKDLVVTCKDIYQMDIGNGSYTEYTISPDVATYMLDHNLMECYQGHIHSHHQMSTFFSGTDTQELKDGGSDTNHFVSLIVNNAGLYTAGITRKIDSKKTIREEFSYKSYNDVEHTGVKEYTTEDTCLEWYNMTIEKACINNSIEEEMIARIKELREERSENISNTTWGSFPKAQNSESFNKPQTSFTTYAGKGNLIQKELPFENDSTSCLDDKIIDPIVRQLITCSVIIPNNSSIDIDKWSRSIPSLYSKRFKSIKTFKEFAEPYVDFLLNYTDIPDNFEYDDATFWISTLAFELSTKLGNLPKNAWIDAYIEILNDYII